MILEDLASEKSAIEKEIGEIAEVYKDFDAILKRVDQVLKRVNPDAQKEVKAARYKLNQGLNLLIDAEDDLRILGEKSRKPTRTPIKLSQPADNLKGELDRIAADAARLSARVRNVGQALYGFKVIKTQAIMADLEKASDVVRTAFVKLTKAQEAL